MGKLIGLIIGSLAIVAAAIWGVNAFLAVDDLQNCDKPDIHSPTCAPADAIIVISGGDTPARTEEAVRLYHDGWAPVIVFSGAALDKTGPSNAAVMRNQAAASGVPVKDTILEEESIDTVHNARQTQKLIPTAGRIIVVTSPYHQKRASLEFKKAFGDTVQVISSPTANDRMWGALWWLTPNGWWLALSETIKTAVVAL